MRQYYIKALCTWNINTFNITFTYVQCIIDYDGIRVGIGVFSFYAFLNNMDKEMNKSL